MHPAPAEAGKSINTVAADDFYRFSAEKKLWILIMGAIMKKEVEIILNHPFLLLFQHHDSLYHIQ